MPQLDFREALSTPEDKDYSPVVAVSAPATQTPPVFSLVEFLHSLRLSRSAWANIVFVTIASVGGLVCAFYFFNGGELLRAAASWPGEYLYPRPLTAEGTAEQPTPVDQFSAISDQTGADKTENVKTAANPNAAPTDLVPPVNTIGSTTPPVVSEPAPPIVPVVPPIVSPPPTALPLTNRVDTFANNADTFVQALLQDPVSTVSNTGGSAPKRVIQSAKKTTTVAKRKLSKVPQKVAATVSSNVQSQQTSTSQTQIGMSTVRPVNQIMTGGGLGGSGSITAIGSGGGTAGASAGSAAGAGAGVVGGASGGLGGLNSGGLGGTISGVGGTVGGVIGGHH